MDHPPEEVHGASLPGAVKSYRHPSSIGVTVPLVASSLAAESEAIAVESIDNFAGSYGPEISPRNHHRLNGDHYLWFGRNRNLLSRPFWNWLAILSQFLHDHFYYFLDVF